MELSGATFLQEQGFTPAAMSLLHGAILALSGVAILLVQATSHLKKHDALDEGTAVAIR